MVSLSSRHYFSHIHRSRKVKNIGGPRVRILGGKGGQIPSRHMTS